MLSLESQGQHQARSLKILTLLSNSGISAGPRHVKVKVICSEGHDYIWTQIANGPKGLCHSSILKTYDIVCTQTLH